MSSLPQLAGSGLLPFVLGFAAGALLVALWLGGRSARLGERLRLLGDRLRGAEEAMRERDALRLELARLEAVRQADAERASWMEETTETLRDGFRSLAGEALETGAEQLAARSGETLAAAVAPVERSLAELRAQVRELELARRGAHAGLEREIALLRDAHRELRATAGRLASALRSPNVRGRWGEVQLRRVVEMAGLVEHVDFVEKPTVGGLRPDLVVHLPGGAVLPVDAKTPLHAFLEAADEKDDKARRRRLEAHRKALRQRIAELGQRAYWRQLERAPDFVVMFVPNDAALAAAFASDPELLDFAHAHRVLPATPVTLLALLKSVAYGWREQRVAHNARAIADLGRELHERLARFAGHLDKLGRGLDGSVAAFNRAVGALERRVMPAARRLGEAGATAADLPAVETVERRTRPAPGGDG
ncbi:MAG: DNA recombination protein RmuC [Acidobacteria bacterium]|nr:MAG: DNA recombination protein RmuC [Acidobacteriota bacterium]